MHIAWCTTLFILDLANVAGALRSGKWCPRACDLALNYATFNDTDPWLSRKVRQCRSDFRITSLYLCFDDFCNLNDGEVPKFIAENSEWCDEHAGVTLPPFHDVVDHWSPKDRAQLPKYSAEKAVTRPILNTAVLPETDFLERAFTTLDAAFFEYDLHLVYGWYMYYFWIVVISFGVGTRLLALITNIRSREYQAVASDDFDRPKDHRSALSLPHSWLKRHITVPAAFGDRCSRPFGWCTIPPRAQTLTIATFIILNTILCCADYRLTEGNLYWPKKSDQALRYVSDRTGIISLANFPLVWLFGMRNDVLMWLTGWGFGTYNAFHRWAARVATLQAIVHSLGYTLMIWNSGGLTHFLAYWKKHYFWNGELATIAMSLLVGFSFYGIRRAHYEIFLVTHIALSIAALWSMYYHVEIFTNGEWNIFIWPCLIIWIFDRMLRGLRILAFDWRFWNTKAIVRYDPISNLVRMDVPMLRSKIAPEPGTYYYIYVLNDPLYVHQNHPFTLAYVTSQEENKHIPLSLVSSRPSTNRTNSASSSESDALLAPKRAGTLGPSMVYLIRPYDGFTSRLKEHCLTRPKTLRVNIEGPYGHSVSLRKYSNVLFMVGGTGIAVPLSHLAHILSSQSTVQNVKIVWAVREHAFLTSMMHEFKTLLGDERCTLEVHVTQDTEHKDDIPGQTPHGVSILSGRPNVYLSVEEAAEGAGQQSLAVVACGPARMADEARKASVQMLADGYTGVEYFEESFKW
ncbi:ferric-chelate reductase [Didymella exigua CBS 183.55]|uniref:Ferric-chelate reductase n=1 Tax=Didymella exigua CBS 183.55 TaxID=1150837 RepID=A0A6A5RE56_9PLEO|nr:ferric-chelate reductase [Didymella exigua CBS 183.55]KAF1925689.1 ferric-chelate reductase [Didymella exigua CBS 183.55]